MKNLTSLLEIPVWERVGDKFICKDIKSGFILAERMHMTLPDNSPVILNETYDAILVKDLEIQSESLPEYIKNEDLEANYSHQGIRYSVIKKGTNIQLDFSFDHVPHLVSISKKSVQLKLNDFTLLTKKTIERKIRL